MTTLTVFISADTLLVMPFFLSRVLFGLSTFFPFQTVVVKRDTVNIVTVTQMEIMAVRSHDLVYCSLSLPFFPTILEGSYLC
jgi:hypothetical protein